MFRNCMLILLCLLLISGCGNRLDEIPENDETALVEVAVLEEIEEDEAYGQIPFVTDMLNEWLLTIKNDDLDRGMSYFDSACEGRLLGDSVSKVRELAFWRSYLANMMNLYVDATLEVETVELNGRGTEGKVVFIMEIEGRKVADDFERRVMANVVYKDGGWKFSRYEELGDRI